MRPLVALVLVAGLLVAAEKPKEKPKKEADKIEGSWTVVKAVHNGKEASEENVAKFKATFKDGKFTVNDGKKDHESTYKLTPAKKRIELVPSDGKFKDKTLVGIYSLKGDDLKICVAEPGKDTPTKYESEADSGHILIILKRAKK